MNPEKNRNGSGRPMRAVILALALLLTGVALIRMRWMRHMTPGQ